ncbi:MAG: 50S ribosomal protein L18 [bacterium]
MKTNNNLKRATRVRAKIKASSALPRLSVFRSSEHIWAQLIDDKTGHTLASSSDKSLKISGTKTEKSQAVGKTIAELALKLGIKKIVFDRGAYRFHGRVKAIAQSARKAGLEF